MPQFIVRGCVLRHETKRTGWWLFKTCLDVIVLLMDTDAIEAARKTIGGYPIFTGEEWQIPSEISVAAPREERRWDRLSVGAIVAVTFEYSGVVARYHPARDPMRVVTVTKLDTEGGPFRSLPFDPQ